MKKQKHDTKPTTAILHYSAPPVIGGVEGVMQAHCQVFIQNEYPVTVIAGRGQADALSKGTEFHLIPELDTQHPEVLSMNLALEQGSIPDTFAPYTQNLIEILLPLLSQYDNLIVHNVFTKHFNLPLTAALFQLVEQNLVHNWIAWCHDFTWTSPNSRSKVFPDYPWDLLRRFDPRITYVTVSEERQKALAELFAQPQDTVKVIYNGVDVNTLLRLSTPGRELISRLNLLEADLIMLMPVRVTQAKNIEYALRLVSALQARDIKPKLVLTGPPDPHSDKSMEYFQSLKTFRADLKLENVMHFVFEAGPDPSQPFQINLDQVGDLYRVSDLVLMPSHREGFGMPVLEAGLVGIPVAATSNVPAATEIGGQDVLLFDPSSDISNLADRLIAWLQSNPQYRLKQRVRGKYTWGALFRNEIIPLLKADG